MTELEQAWGGRPVSVGAAQNPEAETPKGVWVGLEASLSDLRPALIAHCYRMLGSPFDAEDAVQETGLRAWQRSAQFDDEKGRLRSWLFAIATNVCLDMLRSSQRRAVAMDMGPASVPGSPLGVPVPESAWVLPVPDRLALPEAGDPADLAEQRETIRFAFIVALQRLPPRQRAVLILREVLSWSADEVARLLGSSVASVNSALQRARSTVALVDSSPARASGPLSAAQDELLARYCEAFEQYDVDGLVSLLHEDASMSMPPFAWWLRGRSDIRQALRAAGAPCEGAVLRPTKANGSLAFAQYRPTGEGDAHKPFALVTVELRGALIGATTTYLDAGRLFHLFELPANHTPTS